MKYLYSIAIAVLLTACATGPEKTVQSAFTTIDAFVTYEYQNQLAIKTYAPKVHEAAELIRRDAPPLFREAWASIDFWRKNPSTNAYMQVQAALKLIDELLIYASTNLAAAKGAKP